jgi:phosphohistidine swiveling domain-containing protein
MNYKEDKRILDVRDSYSKEQIQDVLERSWFKVVRRENTPLWESLIQAGGALSLEDIGFKNPMKDLYALDYDKYSADEDFKKLKEQFIEACKNNSNFLTDFFKNLENKCEEFDNFVLENEENNWGELSDKDLGAIYDKFTNYSLEILAFLWPPLGPEEWIIEKISSEVSKHIDPVTQYDEHQKAVELLISSEVPSLIQEREFEILKLAVEVQEKDKLSEFKEQIKVIHRKYAWISDHSLKFEYESYEHFENEVLQAIEDNPGDKLAKIEFGKEAKKKKKAELLKKLNLGEDIENYIFQASHLPHWRFLRTERTVEASYLLNGMFEELQKRMGVNPLLAYYWEVGLFLEGKDIDKEKILVRKDGYGLIISNDHIADLDIDSRKTLKDGIESKIELGKVIKGSVACRGLVKGKVRVLNSVKELSKFQDGEILVTSMTTPEFVPIMKMAAAIVTDEGGISCHAAIVSRELKIPCIIGTKTATKALKTGDEVKVDADNGIVKIIK